MDALNENSVALREQAEKIVKNHIMWAIGAGTIPLPLIDMVSVTAIQLDMLRQLCRLYNVDYSENQGKYLVSAIAGSTIARIGASIIKAVPFIGTLVGGLSMAAMSGGSTYAMGQVFITNLGEGKSLFEINVEKGKKLFETAYEKGKIYAEELSKKIKDKGKKENTDSPEE